MYLALTTSSQSVVKAKPTRAFAMITSDPTMVVDILGTYDTSITDPAQGVVIKELTHKNPYAEVTNSSNNVYYVIKQGKDNNLRVWMDAPDVPPPEPPEPTPWSVVRPSATPYTAHPGELVLVDANLSLVGATITLPTAAGSGQSVAIKDTGLAGTGIPTRVVNVTTVGQTIDGLPAPLQITTPRQAYTLVSDGTNWWIV